MARLCLRLVVVVSARVRARVGGLLGVGLAVVLALRPASNYVGPIETKSTFTSCYGMSFELLFRIRSCGQVRA